MIATILFYGIMLSVPKFVDWVDKCRTNEPEGTNEGEGVNE